MKSFLTCIVMLSFFPLTNYKEQSAPVATTNIPAGNLFIITTDGFRWQELFTGADSVLISNEEYTPDTATMKALYWAPTASERRKKLMPFLWSIVGTRGQIFGNRIFNNRVNVANTYAISYPGYNEIFTGQTDPGIAVNRKRNNPNVNVLEYLNSKVEFQGKIAAFSSWDVFPFILNRERNRLPINSGYEEVTGSNSAFLQLINKVQDKAVYDKSDTRHDALTFLAAKEYIREKQPRVTFIGLGETDEYAHSGRYDLYLGHANAVDKMISELWTWIQTTVGYKNNSTIIITTDHGRGTRQNKWTSHGEFIRGSSQAWLAVIGPGIDPLGEIRENGQIYLAQIAQTIATLVGETFQSDKEIAPPILLKTDK